MISGSELPNICLAQPLSFFHTASLSEYSVTASFSSFMGFHDESLPALGSSGFSIVPSRYSTSPFVLRFHRNDCFTDNCFLLRVRSRTLCAQWTCHVLWIRLSHIPVPHVTFSGLAYLVFQLPVSRATGSCTHMFPFPFHVFPLLYRYGLSTCPRILVCLPFLLLSLRLVRLCFSLMPFPVCLVDSSLCLPLLLMPFLL